MLVGIPLRGIGSPAKTKYTNSGVCVLLAFTTYDPRLLDVTTKIIQLSKKSICS